MSTWVKRGAWAAALLVGYLGCAAGNERETTQGAGQGGAGQGGGSPTVGAGGMAGAGGSCATFVAEAEQAPAAMLVALDMSASMSGSKWSAAQLAVVSAIDRDVFDSMSLGLVTFPSSYVNPPPCLCTQIGVPDPGQCAALWLTLTGTPGVSCGVSALPQVAVAPAGTLKSNAGMGVRASIYDYLVANNPISTSDDGSPIYEAMLAGYNALKLLSGIDKRILVVITDGGFSCTSVSNRTTGISDANGCLDWEHPDEVNQLIVQHRDDPTTPIHTFVVGVPGSDSIGQKVGGYDTPPYSMLLALSTYAVSGSPDTVDPDCDSGLTFSQGAPAPAKPCHIDLSNGQMFNAGALADAIADIRGNALGCVYPLPTPPPGETIDPNEVNVNVTVEGMTNQIPRRSDPNDDCASDGCWDYTAAEEVELLGATCAAVSAASTAKVEIVVGCQTVLK